ncbi:MAG: hypothetical protein B7Y88_13745 [Sphingomonadales bacterium 32-64-17]|nr:MAG: hypothetical protein B7Y88_13745 [Sphingomonadales bacterium 32-64-17]
MSEQYDPQVVRQQMAEWQPSGGFTQRKNAYECEECGSWICTIDREQGVTPFMVGCGSCGAMAKSKFYRVSELLAETHEWYRPETLEGLSDWSADHVRRGGLLLRRIGGGDAKEGWRTDSAIEEVDRHRAEMMALYKRKKAELMLEQEEREMRKIRDAVKVSKIVKREPIIPLKREDYPSRQAYRHAVSQYRKGRL